MKKLSKAKVLDAFEPKGGVERDGILFVIKDEKEAEVQSEVKRWLKRIKV